jgi:putative ABC transport system substrate-binding protein
VFRDSLRKHGFIEGENLVIEYRFAHGDRERLPALVADLLDSQVDAVLLADSTAIGPAEQATSTVPLVMAISTDPVGLDRADRLDRPGRNITGQSTMMFDLTAKRFQILADTLPPAETGAPRHPAVSVFFTGLVKAQPNLAGVRRRRQQRRSA